MTDQRSIRHWSDRSRRFRNGLAFPCAEWQAGSRDVQAKVKCPRMVSTDVNGLFCNVPEEAYVSS
jgi:hypothetical protein